jgi:hypothetical protein
MANQGFIIPVRSDLEGMNLQVVDLWPNTSQKNSVYDGAGQSGYISYMLDVPGATILNAASTTYASGSRNTEASNAATTWNLNSVALVVLGAANANVTSEANYGLAAYLRERVHVNPGGANTSMTNAEADAIVTAILARVNSGLSLTLANVNVILNANLGGADNFLDGTTAAALAASSTSFGTLREVLKILEGHVYKTPINTIIEDNVAVWQGKAARDVLIAAATVPATWSSQGAFVAVGDDDPAYLGMVNRADTTAFRASASGGALRKLHDDNFTLLNPNLAYTAAAVTSFRPRATDLTGAALAATGTGRVLTVYDHDGNLLNVP